MTLAPGTRLGPYEIRVLLGAGGMGEVYRATDARLGREVAIKFLPEAVAGDPIRRARFEREAQALAALNHPNIAQIYGLEDQALVMELLDGVTLTEAVADGPLPISKVIDYGSQIARGLAAAHDRGIVHRDLKPDNVFVLKDGHVKIIDFGLAREREAEAGDAAETLTRARLDTEAGMVMGTIGYMSPEQVRAGTIDARTDLFALGAVLYEMITGQRAFKRDTPAETLTAILREDPVDIGTLRADVPPALVRIVSHCLEKNAIERFQTARDVAFALGAFSAVSGPTSATIALPAPNARRSRERLIWIGLSSALAAVALWGMLARSGRSGVSPDTTREMAIRSIVPLPQGLKMAEEIQAPLRVNIAPDSRRIAFVPSLPNGSPSIWEYSLETGLSRMVPGTEGGYNPVWSTDGTRLLFTVGSQLKLRDEQGRILVVPGLAFADFTDDGGYLGLSGSPGRFTLARSKPGGQVEAIYQPTGLGEDILLPKVVTGHRLFVALHRVAPGDPGRRVEIGPIDGGPMVTLINDASTPQVVAGHLLYGRGDRLFAQPVDIERRRLTGEPTLLAERVALSTATGIAYAASDRAIVFLGAAGNPNGKLTVLNRAGKVISTIGEEAEYSNIELSADGRRAAVSLRDRERNSRDIYVVDLARGVAQRLTNDPSDERSAVWSRDGRTIIYNSKGLDLYRRPSDFGGAETPVLLDKISKDPRDVSPDGTSLLYRYSGAGTSNDIWMVSLTGDPKPHAVLATPANENYASFSPDGTSMIYVSDESGRPEVYVMALAGGGRTQISTAGGAYPRWRNPREIVYLGPDSTLMSVPVASGVFGVPARLFPLSYLEGPGTPFDITPDGQTFIVNATTPSTLPPSLHLIVNWQALLTRRQN